MPQQPHIIVSFQQTNVIITLESHRYHVAMFKANTLGAHRGKILLQKWRFSLLFRVDLLIKFDRFQLVINCTNLLRWALIVISIEYNITIRTYITKGVNWGNLQLHWGITDPMMKRIRIQIQHEFYYGSSNGNNKTLLSIRMVFVGFVNVCGVTEVSGPLMFVKSRVSLKMNLKQHMNCYFSIKRGLLFLCHQKW